MFQSKLFNVLTVVLFLCGITMLNCAVAGEKIKWQGTTLTTETKQIEVGDEEGHVLMLSKSKQLYILPDGTKLVGDSVSTMDINPKMKLSNPSNLMKGDSYCVERIVIKA